MIGPMDTKKKLAIIILLVVPIPFIIANWQAIQDLRLHKSFISDGNRVAKVVYLYKNGTSRTSIINLTNVTDQGFTQCPMKLLYRQVFPLDGGGTLYPSGDGFLGIVLRHLRGLSSPLTGMASKPDLKESSTPQPDPSDDSSAHRETSQPPSSVNADVLPLDRGEKLRCRHAGFLESILRRQRCPKAGMASKPELNESSTPQPDPSDGSSAPQETTCQPPTGAKSDLPLDRGEKLRCPRAGFFESILRRQRCPMPAMASKPELNESSTPQPDPNDDSSAPREKTSEPPSGANAERQPLDTVTRLAEVIITVTSICGIVGFAGLFIDFIVWIRALPREVFHPHPH